jgi:hypothetical protein
METEVKKVTEKGFENSVLFKAYKLAKENGFRCFSFQKDTKISQVFVVKNDKIGSISAHFGGVSYSTVHKPNRKTGTGFSLSAHYNCIQSEDINLIYAAINTVCPAWYNGEMPQKFKNWEDFVKRETILTFFEI